MRNLIARIVEKCEKKWINPFRTLFFNFWFLPPHQAIKLPIWVYGKCRFRCVNGIIKVRAERIYSGMIKINYDNIGIENRTIDTEIRVKEGCSIHFLGKAMIGPGNLIESFGKGNIIIGDDFLITANSTISCVERIVFGRSMMITHDCQVIDRAGHFLIDRNTSTVKRDSAPILIGDYAWIGNRSTVSRGTILPNNCIVASNSLVNKDFSDLPEYSLLAGMPAKFIKSGIARITDLEEERRLIKYFESNPNRKEIILD